MRSLTPLLFAGSPAHSHYSRSSSLEPETRSSTPDSVRTDTSTERHIAVSSNTAKNLLDRGVVTQAEYELLSGGLDKAHLEIRNKVNLARAWQSKSERLADDFHDQWDELEQTEVQLEAVQNLLVEEREMIQQSQLQNKALVQDNVDLRHQLNQKNKQQSSGHTKEAPIAAKQKRPPLRQRDWVSLTHSVPPNPATSTAGL